ncbi:MAG: aminoacetone oxidase family FAD-binding enzyme [Clostridia bacterium]|nr:aminoacetone oxidase family FAD-binding enzyme [Clostridia bacterium]
MRDIIDVAIVGGGASGLCSAVSIKSRDRSVGVTVFEQLNRVGKKLITTGNGRCNITNRIIDKSRYHSLNPDFFEFALNRYDNLYTENFFADMGIVFTFEEDKAYPYSLQASSVVDALRFSCDEMGVKTLTETKVTNIRKENDVFVISANGEDYSARTVIVAGGLLSGGEKLGSNASAFNILKANGYKTVALTPAIVQVKTENTLTKSLKGIKVNAMAKLMLNGREINAEEGEVLFCDYGLSGPPILQISREISRQKGDFSIFLDLMPEYSFDKLCDLLNYRVSVLRQRKAEEFFTGMLNKRVGQAVIKLSGIPLAYDVSALRTADIKRLCSIIKNLSFKVISAVGFDNSQVTAGGIDTAEFDDKTMMSKREKGLFCVGEILDVDGDCGGFNLQWAWSSAFAATDGVFNYLEEIL